MSHAYDEIDIKHESRIIALQDELTAIKGMRLPCDIALPPNTILRKGVEVEVLLTALRVRQSRPEPSPPGRHT